MQRSELTLQQALDRDPEFRTTAENLLADEIEQLRQERDDWRHTAAVNQESAKRAWGELAEYQERHR